METATTRKSLTLSNGTEIPVLGLGVWQMKDGEECERAVAEALEVGYRHIDTAKAYGNEHSVGRAIAASPVPREEIFVTTKLWTTDFLDAEAAFEKSRERLGLDYIDLYLIHWPIPLAGDSLWKSFEKLYAKKVVKAIGVSNYSISQLESTIEISRIAPMVNQVEFNPFSHDDELLKFCRSKGITLEAYSPLNRGKGFDHPAIKAASQKYDKTPAQIMLRWAIQKGAPVIPKSSHKERMIENADIFDFEIDTSDMQAIDLIGKSQ
jgi:diketogulonate reductase-like aldo/keto reductase